MGEQRLAADFLADGDAADGADLIAGLAMLDDGFTWDAGPGIVIERADDRPDLRRRVVENGAVIPAFKGPDS